MFSWRLINRSGAPAKIRQHWLDEHFTLVISPPIEFEYADVLLHAPKVQPDDVQVFFVNLCSKQLKKNNPTDCQNLLGCFCQIGKNFICPSTVTSQNISSCKSKGRQAEFGYFEITLFKPQPLPASSQT
jgi:hypothetical protein